jgi:hypothetical protein
MFDYSQTEEANLRLALIEANAERDRAFSERDTLRAALEVARQENDGNNQIESDLLAMQADRASLRASLESLTADNARLLEALETVLRDVPTHQASGTWADMAATIRAALAGKEGGE